MNKIETFWDKAWRVWVILVIDGEGNQVGNADYAPNKTQRDEMIKKIKEDI